MWPFGKKLNDEDRQRLGLLEQFLKNAPEGLGPLRSYGGKLDEFIDILKGKTGEIAEEYERMIPIYQGIYESAKKRLEEKRKADVMQSGVQVRQP
jgi:hypothetical protein